MKQKYLARALLLLTTLCILAGACRLHEKERFAITYCEITTDAFRNDIWLSNARLRILDGESLAYIENTLRLDTLTEIEEPEDFGERLYICMVDQSGRPQEICLNEHGYVYNSLFTEEPERDWVAHHQYYEMKNGAQIYAELHDLFAMYAEFQTSTRPAIPASDHAELIEQATGAARTLSDPERLERLLRVIGSNKSFLYPAGRLEDPDFDRNALYILRLWRGDAFLTLYLDPHMIFSPFGDPSATFIVRDGSMTFDELTALFSGEETS